MRQKPYLKQKSSSNPWTTSLPLESLHQQGLENNRITPSEHAPGKIADDLLSPLVLDRGADTVIISERYMEITGGTSYTGQLATMRR